VDRDGALILSAPPDAEDATLRDVVSRKRQWVYRQLARLDLLYRPARPKEFVDGEGLSDLGRSYRLRLVPESDCPVKLQSGRFLMPEGAADQGRQHTIQWYSGARPGVAI